MFANGTAGARYVSADGTWLSTPDAALVGNVNNSAPNSDSAVLLTLSNPTFDADTKVHAPPACHLPCRLGFAVLMLLSSIVIKA